MGSDVHSCRKLWADNPRDVVDGSRGWVDYHGASLDSISRRVHRSVARMGPTRRSGDDSATRLRGCLRISVMLLRRPSVAPMQLVHTTMNVPVHSDSFWWSRTCYYQLQTLLRHCRVRCTELTSTLRCTKEQRNRRGHCRCGAERAPLRWNVYLEMVQLTVYTLLCNFSVPL